MKASLAECPSLGDRGRGSEGAWEVEECMVEQMQ